MTNWDKLAIGVALTTLGAVYASHPGKGGVPSSAPVLPEVCSLTSTGCVAINMSADPPSAGGFSGYADPSERCDPQFQSGNVCSKLWLAYSYPLTKTSSTHTVETHMLYSTNHGATWSNSGLNNGGVIYSSVKVTNGHSGNTSNFTSHETPNMIGQVVTSAACSPLSTCTFWYFVHQFYYVAPGGSGDTQTYSTRMVIAGCADTTGGVQGPMCIQGVGSPQFTGGSETDGTNFPITVNWTTLSSALTTGYREPTFTFQTISSTLNLCLLMNTNNTLQYSEFCTPTPSGSLNSWTWSYEAPVTGGFANQADAQSLCNLVAACANTESMTQGDIGLNQAGSPVMQFDLVHFDLSSNKIADGVVTVELSATVPPAFVRLASGAPKVDKVVTCSDCTTVGMGTSTYEPSSLVTGVIVAHKVVTLTGATTTFLMATGALP